MKKILTLAVFILGWVCHPVLGQTIDDAAGEAFDKGGKIIASRTLQKLIIFVF